MALRFIDTIRWSGQQDTHASTPGMSEQDSVRARKLSAFRSWLSSEGGYLSPDIEFAAGMALSPHRPGYRFRYDSHILIAHCASTFRLQDRCQERD